MLYLKRFEGITFYLLIFSISLQLGKHFWPPYSFVNGIRLDYLSPTLYVSDIFIGILFLLVLTLRPKELVASFTKSLIFILFMLSLLLSSFFAFSSEAAFVWNLRVIEMIFFGWYVSQFTFIKENIQKMLDVLVFSAFIQSVIAFFQFAIQKSIGGPLYFLGERSFDVHTIGIATFFTGGRELLRPYGTFPHPNVLALFLSIAFIMCASYIVNNKTNKRAYIYIFFLLPILVALLLTASRLIIVLTIALSLVALIKKKIHVIYLLVLLTFLLPFYLVIFSGRFLGVNPFAEAVQIRIELLMVNLRILFDNLLFGVGPNNSFFSEYNKALPVYVRFQPVHNIYLHYLVQLGLFGGVATIMFGYKLFRKLISVFRKNKFPSFPAALLLVEILIIGLFDHFPITLQQGMLMSTLIIGLLLNRSLVRE